MPLCPRRGFSGSAVHMAGADRVHRDWQCGAGTGPTSDRQARRSRHNHNMVWKRHFAAWRRADSGCVFRLPILGWKGCLPRRRNWRRWYVGDDAGSRYCGACDEGGLVAAQKSCLLAWRIINDRPAITSQGQDRIVCEVALSQVNASQEWVVVSVALGR